MDIVEQLRGPVWSLTVEQGTVLLNQAATEIERLRAAIEDAIETMEAMDLHTDNPLYGRLRSALEQGAAPKKE